MDSANEHKNWKEQLQTVLKKPTVLLAIGNTLRGDDGAGPIIVQSLKEFPGVHALDGGTAPENLLGTIAAFHPQALVLIDAVNLGAEPGSIRLLKGNELQQVDLSTHGISPKLLIEFLRDSCTVDPWLLGVQPERTGIGNDLSDPCRKAIEEIVDFFLVFFSGMG